MPALYHIRYAIYDLPGLYQGLDHISIPANLPRRNLPPNTLVYSALQPSSLDRFHRRYLRLLSALALLLAWMEERYGRQMLQPERLCHVPWRIERGSGCLDACTSSNSSLFAENAAQTEAGCDVNVQRRSIVSTTKLTCEIVAD